MRAAPKQPGPFSFVSWSRRVKIKSLETFSTPNVAFVRVTAEDGMQGWGQVSPYNADITCQVFHRQVARWAIGADARRHRSPDRLNS